MKDSIGLVANGSGRNSSGSNVQFSNKANSLCTSLGKYKIDNSYNGNFGLAFKLSGLNATKSNAIKHFVVLHSNSRVPNKETVLLPIRQSWDFLTVASLFLLIFKKCINKSDKPVLLHIYY